jgi:hypothetical protein
MRGVPEKIVGTLQPASIQLNDLDEPSVPYHDGETIYNISRFSENNRLAWEQFKDGFKAMHELLARTLAVKLKFSQSSPVLGYNKRAVELTDLMLVALEAVGSCTPWQMASDPDGYYHRVATTSHAVISNAERLKMWDHMQEGKMWSGEMAEDPVVNMWLTRLKTGV